MSNNGGLEVTFDTSQFERGLSTLLSTSERKIATTMRYFANRAESSAKSNAPWTDQTGNARNGLRGMYEGGGSQHRIVLQHGVPYGIWLEVRFSGRYAIIQPTIQRIAPEVFAALRGIFQ